MEAEVDAFLAERPHYSREHVEEIARFCQGSVPFCGGCKDWHHPSEQHSEG
jgi:hypothetical protein